ncbi:Tetratricopeptide repeat-domain-containing protein [Baffinella frigidus]|nr:Tetratricopeptide repeat-domain-containing protein [Cryptophyta sp. CCMP2293]
MWSCWSCNQDVAASYDDKAIVCQKQGKLDEALELYEKCLAIRVKFLGPDHPDVVDSCNKMVVVYELQGKPEEALELKKKIAATFSGKTSGGYLAHKKAHPPRNLQ